MLHIIGSSPITTAVCVESAMYVSSIEGCFSRPVEVSDPLLLHIWNSSLVGAGPLEGCEFAPSTSSHSSRVPPSSSSGQPDEVLVVEVVVKVVPLPAQ